jgi:ComF family protein
MGLLDVLLPPACAACGRYGEVVCETCLASLIPLWKGASAFLAPDAGVVVGDALTLAVAAVAHRDAAQRILRRLKYGGGTRLADPLAAVAHPALDRLLAVSGPAHLVPVPLHEARRRDRGYNQAHLLAVAMARRSGLPVWPALARARATERQHGLDRAARLRNIRQAMALDPRLAVRGESPPAAAIVVDDILTTGATLEACATILRGAGVERVYGFAIAREV